MSATLLKMIRTSSLVMGAPCAELVEESEAVDSVREEDPEEGGVGGAVAKGRVWPVSTGSQHNEKNGLNKELGVSL